MPDSTPTTVEKLQSQVAEARGRLALQNDPALLDVLSNAEMDADRDLAEWTRTKAREQRRKAVAAEAAAADRERRNLAGIARADDEDGHWHRRALAAQRRVTSPHARLAMLHRRSEWSSRALVGVVLIGMTWAALNVQHNLVPDGNMANPLFWLSFGVEAMISIPLVVIMLVATTAATWGREIKRHKIIAFELGLLAATVGLNVGPHLAQRHYINGAEYAVAPVMVGVVIWLHAWVSTQYANLIAEAAVPEVGAPSVDLPAAAPEPAAPELPSQDTTEPVCATSMMLPPESAHTSGASPATSTAGAATAAAPSGAPEASTSEASGAAPKLYSVATIPRRRGSRALQRERTQRIHAVVKRMDREHPNMPYRRISDEMAALGMPISDTAISNVLAPIRRARKGQAQSHAGPASATK